jgi:hypothetical protein
VSDLQAAARAAAEARAELTATREKIAGLERDLAPARRDLDVAQAEFTAALGSEALGEGNPATTKAARKTAGDAEERVRGIGSALSVLRQREREQAKRVEQLEADVRAKALPLAVEARDAELRRMRVAFDQAAQSLKRWHELATYCRGSEATGAMLTNEMGIAPILTSYGVAGDLRVGRSDGMTAPMSVEQLMTIIG